MLRVRVLARMVQRVVTGARARVGRRHVDAVVWLALTACASPVGTRHGQAASFYKAQPLAIVASWTPSRGVRHVPQPSDAATARQRPMAAAHHPATAPNAPAYTLLWPVEGQITSRFGTRSGRPHDGIDISAPQGTPIKAAAAGLVLYSAPHGTYGNLVVLKHDDGLVTVYAHNDRNLVRKGQAVEAGQLLGKVGQTGRATGPHLHFEVRRGTRPDNPLEFLPP